MEVYRIAKENHSEIDGLGGLLYPGRWHEKGNTAVYASEHRSLAAFEVLVHISKPQFLKNKFMLLSIYIPDDSEIFILPQEELKKGWDRYEFLPEMQIFGTQFLKEKKYLLMKVPSVVIKQEFNFIINPAHPQFNFCKVTDSIPFLFDQRLMDS